MARFLRSLHTHWQNFPEIIPLTPGLAIPHWQNFPEIIRVYACALWPQKNFWNFILARASKEGTLA